MSITADRVKETTTTTGTGAYSLGGAVTGFRAFSSAFTTGSVVMYCVENGTAWEVGEGTLTTGSPWTLARTTVLSSSNGGSAVDWAAGTKNVFSTLPAARVGRETLYEARTYYVRTDGSDSNDGLANTSGGAFLTIQKAVDVVCALDMSIYQVTIQVGTGTYTGSVVLMQPLGSLPPLLLGDASTPSNVLISTSSSCISLAVAAAWRVQGVKLTSSASHGLYASAGMLSFLNIDFGACTSGRHIYADGPALIRWTGAYTISGGAGYHVIADLTGIVRTSGSFTVTITGTPAFSSNFAYVTRLALYYPAGTTWSGSATGNRYSVTKNAVLDTNGQATTWLPGSVSGSTATGGQYT